MMVRGRRRDDVTPGYLLDFSYCAAHHARLPPSSLSLMNDSPALSSFSSLPSSSEKVPNSGRAPLRGTSLSPSLPPSFPHVQAHHQPASFPVLSSSSLLAN